MLALLIYVLFAHQEIHLDANHLLLPSQVELCLLVTVVHPIQKPVLRYAMGLLLIHYRIYQGSHYSAPVVMDCWVSNCYQEQSGFYLVFEVLHILYDLWLTTVAPHLPSLKD